MALVMCPLCMEQEDVEVLGELPDGRQKAKCHPCDFPFDYGEARPTTAPPARQWSPRGLPSAAQVAPAAMERAEHLKAEFLGKVQPEPAVRMVDLLEKYRAIFSPEGLAHATEGDFEAFALDGTVNADPMRAFPQALKGNRGQAVDRLRQVVEYLLRADDKPLPDRLTDLINGDVPFSFPGFKEALLSKVLAVVHPEQFLTIVTYDQKVAAAKKVYGLVGLPPKHRAHIGHQILWSNGLLAELTGEGFADRAHAGEFLWWAQDQPPG